MDSTTLQEINDRVNKLEKRDVQDFLTLLELMSNVYFFGGMKRDNCDYSRDGQCSLFYLQKTAKNKVPVATECRIADCETHDHCHLEISNMTCIFCPRWNNNNHADKLIEHKSSGHKSRRPKTKASPDSNVRYMK